MTATTPSRWTPQQREWLEDLAPRELLSDPHPPVYNAGLFDLDACHHINDHYLEIAQPRSPLRCMTVLFALLCLAPLTVLVMFAGDCLTNHGSPDLTGFAWNMLGISLILALMTGLIRSAYLSPRQDPIRFCRTTGKIYMHSYRQGWRGWMMLGRWGTEVTVWDWATTQALIERAEDTVSAGRISTPITILSLVLIRCVPGSSTIADRKVLCTRTRRRAETGDPAAELALRESEAQTILRDYRQIWSFLRTYMAQGRSGVTQPPLLNEREVFWRCVGDGLLGPFSPGPEGNMQRVMCRRLLFNNARLWWIGIPLLLFKLAIHLALSPLALLLFLIDYSTRLTSPLTAWPEAIDAETRGLGINTLR